MIQANPRHGWQVFDSPSVEHLPLSEASQGGSIVGPHWVALRSDCITQFEHLPEPVGFAQLQGGLTSAPPRLIVTDVDSTLIEQEVIDELAELAGQRTQVEEITERAMRGELDFAQSLTKRVALLAGLSEGAFHEVRQSLTLTAGAKALIAWSKRVGAAFGVVSGGFSQIVDPLVEELGLDYARSITLEVVDGHLTGKVVGPIVTAQEKVRALTEWSQGDLARVVAVGDGANDIPMLKAAALGIAFCAKPIVVSSVGAFLNLPRLDAVAGLLGHDPAD